MSRDPPPTKEIVGERWTSFNGALIRRVNNLIQWSTRRAIEEALARANATDVQPAALPSEPLKSITKHETQRLDHIDKDKRDFNPVRTKQYMKNQGSHIWVSQLGRADVAVTVSQNASVMAGPSEDRRWCPALSNFPGVNLQAQAWCIKAARMLATKRSRP